MTATLAIFPEAWPIAWQCTYAVLSKTTTEDTLNAGLTNCVGETATICDCLKTGSAQSCVVLGSNAK